MVINIEFNPFFSTIKIRNINCLVCCEYRPKLTRFICYCSHQRILYWPTFTRRNQDRKRKWRMWRRREPWLLTLQQQTLQRGWITLWWGKVRYFQHVDVINYKLLYFFLLLCISWLRRTYHLQLIDDVVIDRKSYHFPIDASFFIALYAVLSLMTF